MTAKRSPGKRIEGGRGRTTILNAKALSEYGRHMVKALREVNDSKIILPVMAYYGTSRMWKDNKLFELRKDISLERGSALRRLYGAFVII